MVHHAMKTSQYSYTTHLEQRRRILRRHLEFQKIVEIKKLKSGKVKEERRERSDLVQDMIKEGTRLTAWQRIGEVSVVHQEERD